MLKEMLLNMAIPSRAGRLRPAFLTSIIAVVFTISATPGANAASTPVNVLTYHNNSARSGLNWNETTLTLSKVKAGIFGKLFSLPVDGYIYAEPLYVSGLNIPGKGINNVIFVATEHDSVYAFAAGNPNGGNPLWKKTLIDPTNGITTVSSSALDCFDISPEVGITSTPVIDLTTKTLYVVSAAFNSKTSEYFQQLHALDLSTGAEKFNGPVTISASVPGTGYGDGGDTDGMGNVIFDPKMQYQRDALLLSGGMVYVAFGSHCDAGEYHGWVLGYDAATLKRVAAFNSTPNGQAGGIWQSGNGPATTGNGAIFVGVGNGSFDPSQQNYGDSFVKLVAGTLKVFDYFTPTDQQSFADNDVDFGIAGPLLLPPQSGPVPNELIGGGKSAVLYVLNRSNMGKYCASCNPSDSQVVQTVSSSELFGMYSTPAYWNGFVYQSSYNGPLLAFKLAKGKLSANPVAQTSVTFSYEGATPVVSSNGPKNGIVWILLKSTSSDPRHGLYAFRATDLTELYDSSQVAGDAVGPDVKFAVPTVVNGRVYVGTQTELDVYGILP